jgi:small-conductance mechanosensitive channel
MRSDSRKSRSFIAIFLIAVNLISFTFSVGAQESLLPNSNSNEKAASPTPTVAPEATPIPLSEVITQAEATQNKLQEIQKTIGGNTAVSNIDQKLPKLKQDIDAIFPETTRQISQQPSLDTLGKITQDWESLGSEISAWKSDLKDFGTALDTQIKELETLTDIWQKTLNSTKLADENSNSPPPQVPPEILESIGIIGTAIKNTQSNVQKQRGDLLTLQSRISEQEKRINGILETVKNVREEALTHLFVKDSPLIWNAQKQTNSANGLMMETESSFIKQFNELQTYSLKQQESFFWHFVIFILLTLGLYWVRGRVKPLVKKEPKIKRAMSIFQIPVATALVLTILLSGWFYPQPPRLLSAILGAFALFPGVLLLRRLLEKPMFPILNALMVFYFIDRLRDIFTSLPIIGRYLFLAEMLGAIIFLVWFLRSKKLSDRIQVRHQRIFKIIKRVIPFALFIFGSAFIANAFGYVSLGRILGNGLLGSAYIALIIYAVVRIIQSLLTFAVRVRPFSSLGMVKTHRRLFQDKILRVVRWIAILIWFILTLNVLSIREPFFNYINGIIFAELKIGSISISLGDILAFLFTVWLAFVISRLVRFILDEDVYPRINLAGGVPYAVSTILHYSLLLLGFFIAIAALGIDLSKFTILAGAFGVGLGFGLQNIVNNFVSGLILLFERPVKVGDVLQLRETQGDLKRIGLRASVLRTLDGSEIIVPNGHLISEEVTNWTFSDRIRRIQVDVGVAYGNDPEKIIELLTKVALSHPDIVKEPMPRTLFIGFGESSLDFQLRAWTAVASQWMNVKSDLAVGIYKALKEAEIEIPFPQRDLHLKSVNEKLLENLKKD